MFIDLSIILPDLIALMEWILMIPNSNCPVKPILFYNQFHLVNCDVRRQSVRPSIINDKDLRKTTLFVFSRVKSIMYTESFPESVITVHERICENNFSEK